MKARYIPVLLIPILAVILSACRSASAEIINTETSEPTKPNQETTAQFEENKDFDPTQDEGESNTEDTSKLTPTPLIADSPPGVGHSDCGDPFEGESIRFQASSWETNFCQHSVPYGEFLSGGPPRDGIPPIDEPEFESVDSADVWLEDREPVITFVLNGEVRAYPLQILIWHEIVNDVVGEVPVVVTFCPLCNTALVFERPVINGELLTFGTSGNLRNSDLVMWDRQTESWWQQFTGEALVGDLTGTQLTFLPAAILSWEDFKEKYSQSQVLSQDTGFFRNYGANPYLGYDNVNQFPFLFDGEVDDRLRAMTRVLGVVMGEFNTAYVYDRLIEDLVINDTLGETPVVAFWKAGTASALDSSSISEGRDVGTTGFFLRTLEDQVLTFTANEDGTFSDEETGSTWDILGEALNGSLEGKSLIAVPHHDTFWFAWAAFIPDGTLTE